MKVLTIKKIKLQENQQIFKEVYQVCKGTINFSDFGEKRK